MTIENALVCPAYYVEAKGFNPIYQSKNPFIRELAARVVALTVPVFYLYQVVLHGVVSALDITLLLCGCSGGMLLASSLPSTCYSVRNFASSLFEIPQKILCGPHFVPNYFGDSHRYDRINFLSTVGKFLP